MPPEYAAHAFVRLVHAPRVYGADEGHTVRLWNRLSLRCYDKKWKHILASGRERKQLAVQGVHQLLAILHPCKLLLDINGGSLLAQLSLSSTLHRYKLKHHWLRLPRMGWASLNSYFLSNVVIPWKFWAALNLIKYIVHSYDIVNS